jgi:hypothetical protein
MKRIWMATALTLVSLAPTAFAAEAPTVESLLAAGYTVVGTIPSTAGPGIFLQKERDLIVCFVAETPTSPTVATQYCKPVR